MRTVSLEQKTGTQHEKYHSDSHTGCDQSSRHSIAIGFMGKEVRQASWRKQRLAGASTDQEAFMLPQKEPARSSTMLSDGGVTELGQ